MHAIDSSRNKLAEISSSNLVRPDSASATLARNFSLHDARAIDRLTPWHLSGSEWRAPIRQLLAIPHTDAPRTATQASKQQNSAAAGRSRPNPVALARRSLAALSLPAPLFSEEQKSKLVQQFFSDSNADEIFASLLTPLPGLSASEQLRGLQQLLPQGPQAGLTSPRETKGAAPPALNVDPFSRLLIEMQQNGAQHLTGDILVNQCSVILVQPLEISAKASLISDLLERGKSLLTAEILSRLRNTILSVAHDCFPIGDKLLLMSKLFRLGEQSLDAHSIKAHFNALVALSDFHNKPADIGLFYRTAYTAIVADKNFFKVALLTNFLFHCKATADLKTTTWLAHNIARIPQSVFSGQNKQGLLATLLTHAEENLHPALLARYSMIALGLPEATISDDARNILVRMTFSAPGSTIERCLSILKLPEANITRTDKFRIIRCIMRVDFSDTTQLVHAVGQVQELMRTRHRGLAHEDVGQLLQVLIEVQAERTRALQSGSQANDGNLAGQTDKKDRKG